MTFRIQDIIFRELIKDLKYINPNKGIDRVVKRVSVHDSPVRDDVLDRGVIQGADLIISNCFFQKDSPSDLRSFIELLYGANCAGLLLSNQYIESFPENIENVIDDLDFPILVFDHKIGYADIIQVVMEEIINERNTYINEYRIEKLLSKNINESGIKEIVNQINPQLNANIVAMYIKNNKVTSQKIRTFPVINFHDNKIKYELCHYKDGFYIITSIENKVLGETLDCLDYIINNLILKISDYVIGVSDCHEDIYKLPIALKEALDANKNADILKSESNIYLYKNLGINRIVISNENSEEMLKFYKDVISPIIQYDEKQNNNLYVTLVCFIETKGDYKKTSKKLYTHENTVRYRISQIRQILNKQDDIIEFYELISMALRIEKHLKNKGIL